MDEGRLLTLDFDSFMPESQAGDRNRFNVFFDLMKNRVREVLLVASLYDYFILEEDGRLSDRIFRRYSDLQLSTPPRITRVSSREEALDVLQRFDFDLVITMRRVGDEDPFAFGAEIKEYDPDLPVVLLVSSYAELSHIPPPDEWGAVDRVFVWNGNSAVFVAIIKLIEDEMNAPEDTENGLVQVILIVEDSVDYYSLFIPTIYAALYRQTDSLMEKGVNRIHRLLQMRIRPKIMLATTFEQGLELYETYRENILGVISDFYFPRNGKKDPDAGIEFVKIVHQDNPFIPTLLQSNNVENEARAVGINSLFLFKRVPDLLKQVSRFMKRYLGFGDFVFETPDGDELGRASNLLELEQVLAEVAPESLLHHAASNHFSNWLLARGEFQLAQSIRPLRASHFHDAEGMRTFLIDIFSWNRQGRHQGIITQFDDAHRQVDAPFVRIGEGSLGGKGRGLAFLSSLLSSPELKDRFPWVDIAIPDTIVIGTEYFDIFIEENGLFETALGPIDDRELKQLFLSKPLSTELVQALRSVAVAITHPLAIRSSSLLEDSQFQPFAGIYETYMLPNNSRDPEERLNQICRAVKLVYASVFSQLAKSYIATIGQRIEAEKMAVVIQKVVGRQFEDRFYPDFAGVAQSYNYYPISHMTPEDGICYVALGLGATVEMGGTSLRFCPKYPEILPQLSSVEEALSSTQNEFYALRIERDNHPDLLEGDTITLQKLNYTVAVADGIAEALTSGYDRENHRIVTGPSKGSRVVTFEPILQKRKLPLANLLRELLVLGAEGFACPIEIEFAVVMEKPIPRFRLLQMRPLVSEWDRADIDIAPYRENALVHSGQALGNGVIPEVRDIIYVKPENFDKLKTIEIQAEIGQLNSRLADDARHYVLIGPGRWGTSERFLGIPVNWNDIYFAKVLVEVGLKDFQVDPSQGMHFFVNVTSTGMGYFTVPYSAETRGIDWDWLDAQEAENETHYLRHISLDKPLIVRINGKDGEGVVAMPTRDDPQT